MITDAYGHSFDPMATALENIGRDLLATQKKLDAATARAERAEAAIERVRALHVQGPDWKGRPQCEECASLCHSRSGLSCDEPDGAWPCPTIAALDSTDPVEAAPKESVCPTCGPTTLERHPRLSVMRCSNCKEHLRSDSALPVDGSTT